MIELIMYVEQVRDRYGEQVRDSACGAGERGLGFRISTGSR